MGLGLVPILLAWPVLYFLFRPIEMSDTDSSEANTDQQTGKTLREAFHDYRFWVLLLSILFAYMGFSGISPNLFPSLTDDGFSREQAASILSVFGVSIITGRIIVGYLIDRFWAPGIAMVCLLMPVIGTIIFYGDQTFIQAILASFLIGFAAGAELDLMAFMAARYFGLRHYAKIYSILYASLAVCSGTAPMLFASVYDRTASYDLGFAVATVLFLLSSLIILSLGRYPRAYANAH